MVMVGYDHQDVNVEAVIYVAYFRIICAMGVERRDKGSALFHIIINVYAQNIDCGYTLKPLRRFMYIALMICTLCMPSGS